MKNNPTRVNNRRITAAQRLEYRLKIGAAYKGGFPYSPEKLAQIKKELENLAKKIIPEEQAKLRRTKKSRENGLNKPPSRARRSF